VGGNLVNYPGKLSTPTAEMSNVKILFNSTISTKNGQFTVFDLNHFYLGTPLWIWEYIHIDISTIPDSVVSQCNLLDLVHNGYMLVEIMKGMYWLPQSGILAYAQFDAHLGKFGYAPCPQTTCL
jgi:hypothetical protein